MSKNFYKTALKLNLLIFAFFIPGCGDKTTEPQSSGTVTSGSPGSGQTKVFEKSCSAGRIQIFKAPSSSGASQPGFAGLKVGDKVTIKGTVTNGSACLQGNAYWTCSASMQADKRTFICEQGTVSQGSLTTTTGAIPTGHSSSGYQINQGQIDVFGNGTQISVGLTFQKPYTQPAQSGIYAQVNIGPQLPQQCVIGFNCL